MKRITLICLSFLFAGLITSCKKTITETSAPAPTVDSLRIGLIAYYPFNNSGVDSSGKGNHGTINNITATADRYGKANKAYYFNGVSSYVVVDDNPELRLNNTNITLSAWIKLDAYNGSFGSNILSKHLTGNDKGWAWGVAGSAFTPTGVVTWGPGGTSISSRGNKVISLNQWHMLTTVYNVVSKQTTVYVDGDVDNVLNNNMPSPNAAIDSKIYIGRDEPTAAADGYFVKGALDDVRIYNRLLSAAEVKKLYVYKY